MFLITIGFLSIVGIIIGFYLTQRIRFLTKNNDELIEIQNKNDLARTKLEQRLNIVLNLTHEYTEARDENQIIETLLSMSIDLTGAVGSSFVPLDDNGKPMAAIRKGEFSFPVPDAWLEYLADPGIRQSCQACVSRAAIEKNCALLHGPFSDAMGVYCFPLRYGERELGLLNIFIPGLSKMDAYVSEFLNSITEATALALESDRLRNRELITISQLSKVRQKHDLDATLANVLENLQKALFAEFGILVLVSTEELSIIDLIKSKKAFVSGNLNPDMHLKIEQILLKFKNDKNIVTILDGEDGDPERLNWLGIPVNYPNQSNKGWLLLACSQQIKFSQRRILLAESVAEKLSLMVQNSESLAAIEYKILMEERTRLAREIHDGLAQTLGFLKLQIAQMFGYLDRQDLTRLQETMRTCYQALSEAYQDTRLAIDGLRVSPYRDGGYNLKDWLTQTADYYADFAFDIKINCSELTSELPPEMHAQLIRIVQEALSNIRKHAQANSVWIECMPNNRDLIIEIRDDGVGFAPENIPDPSRYGLKGMKERSELLGADFQVISRSGEGTTIRVRIPIEEQNWMEV